MLAAGHREEVPAMWWCACALWPCAVPLCGIWVVGLVLQVPGCTPVLLGRVHSLLHSSLADCCCQLIS
jgi:hypothetical protein